MFNLSYLNIAAYVLNVAITYLVGTYGVFGANTQNDLSKKYQTLVTPAAFAFSIWGIIFISQLIFVVVQLLKSFRSKDIVVKGVRYNYIGACIAQAAWVVAFDFEIIWLSFILMLAILYFLIKINVNQYGEELNIRDFWLLKFPFSIHCGWISAASFVNLNVMLVKYSISAHLQYYTALFSLVVLVHAAIFLILISRPQFVIPSVLSWALFGIYSELKDPKDLIKNTFDQPTISSVQHGALYTMFAILAALLIRSVMEVVKKVNSQKNDEGNAYVSLEDNDNEEEA